MPVYCLAGKPVGCGGRNTSSSGMRLAPRPLLFNDERIPDESTIAVRSGRGRLTHSLSFRSRRAFLHFYIIPDKLNFGIFPWMAFVAFGMSVGSILRRTRPEDLLATTQWFGWGGLALAFGCWTILKWGSPSTPTPITALTAPPSS